MITLSGIWFLWIALTIICAFIIIFGLRSVLKRTFWNLSQRSRIIRVNSVVIILWMILLWVLANVGFFARFDRIPPPVTLALWLPLPFIIYVAISQWGNQLLQVVSAHVLIFIQAFRILVEILLWLTYKAGHLPIQMTFEGGNLDILT